MKTTLTQELVDQIIKKIHSNTLHDAWLNKEEGYEAVLITPYGYYSDVYNNAIEALKLRGYDCFIKACYDARGPHDCLFFKAMQ